MLFPETDAPLLKRWIVKRLEDTSDADADVLADYILALLRHDGDTETVRRLCEEEIPDFLKEDSAVFVRDVFDAIRYKSYAPGVHRPSDQDKYSGLAGTNKLPGTYGSDGSQMISRKRSRGDASDYDLQSGQDLRYAGEAGGRAFKQPRRGRGMARVNGSNEYDHSLPRMHSLQGQSAAEAFQQYQNMPQMPKMPSPPPGMPSFDPSNPLAALLAMQAMGFQLPDLPSPAPHSLSSGPRGTPGDVSYTSSRQCRDYVTKGFCTRGSGCRFEHGNDPIHVPPVDDEYDPTNALIAGLSETKPVNSYTTASSSIIRDGEKARGRGRGRGSRNDRGGMGASGQGRGGRADFSSDRPNFDKTKTTIVVENIPEENFSEEAVRGFFSQFGAVTEITMQPYKRLVIVKYGDWTAAKNAYSSPKVIFDNRFVKVYWHTGVSQSARASNGQDSNGKKVPTSVTSADQPMDEDQEPKIDLEVFAKKQEEAQVLYHEKMKKRMEMEAAQKALGKRQEELLRSQAEEKRKLMQKLAAKTAKPVASPGVTEQSTTPTLNAKTSQTDALKAQLAALEAEAKSLGIDPNAEDDSSWSSRGRGRGRGAYRGRGVFLPGGARGAYRGRGGVPYPGNTGHKLDNRPRKVAMTGIDFTNPDKDESLRQYLLGIGEYTELQATPNKAFITFKDRFTAERFFYGSSDGEIPSVGKVEMAWVQTPLPPVDPAKFKLVEKPVASAETANNQVTDHEVVMQDTITEDHDHKGGDGNQDLDYEVADWD